MSSFHLIFIPEAKILASLSTSLHFQTSRMVHSLSKTPLPGFFQVKSACVLALRLKDRLNPSWCMYFFCNTYLNLCSCIACIILQLI